MFVVEGIRHVGEAVDAANAPPNSRERLFPRPVIEYLCYAPDLLTSEFAIQLIQEQSTSGVPCYPMTSDVFESIADKENPQGILAVVRQRQPKLAQFSSHAFPWWVALVDPQDPGNLGTILRSVDAVGADGLLLLEGTVDPYHPNAVRASMGTLFWYPVVEATFEEFAKWARQNAYHIYGTSAHGSIDYRQVQSYASPRILLMGSEREGLNAAQAGACEVLISLPMRGHATSLNLAVATGVMLYEMLARDGSSAGSEEK